MDWKDVVNHPSLQDLPFKIETNELDEIIMTSQTIRFSIFRGKINYLLYRQKSSGLTLTNCAIRTRKGTKVADVAWATMQVSEKIKDETDASIAPEICVEVVSMSNTNKEMKMKRQLYFEKGAKEVWVCDEYGAIRFFDETGEIEKSVWFPDFPKKISIGGTN